MEPLLQDLIERGKKSFKNRDFIRAERCFLAVTREGRQYPDILNLLGVIYHHQGKFNNAIDSFKQAIAINPDYLEASLNLAVLYNDLGQYQEARKLYNRLGKKTAGQRSSIDPILKGRMANQHAEMGDTYRRLGYFKEAVEEYEKALGLAPEFSDIRLRLGVALREMGQLTRSKRELKKVAHQKPYYHKGLIQLGVTLYMGGQKKEAAREWQHVMKRDPQNETAALYLSLCQAKK